MIFLIGISRVGKTAIGKKLAEELSMDFFDTDIELRNKYLMEIPSLYESKGEKEFRKIEFSILKSLSKNRNSIISTGGGLVENLNAVEFLKNQQTVIFLKSKPEAVFKRIESEFLLKNTFPKFLGNVKTNKEAKSRFLELYNKRIRLYSYVSTLCLDVETMSIANIVNKLKSYIVCEQLM